jgi:hypothetical protein
MKMGHFRKAVMRKEVLSGGICGMNGYGSRVSSFKIIGRKAGQAQRRESI